MGFVLDAFHVGEVHGALALDNGALGVLLALAGMALDQLHAFDDDALFFGKNGDDAAMLAFFLSGQHEDFIAFFDMTLHKFIR
jgi:hypothetical protein